MTDDLTRIREKLIRETVQDRSEEIARLQSANEKLHHRVKCLETENRGLYAKLELLREHEGDRELPGVSFASLEQSASGASK